ncbi:hypothetical protein GLYMA_02G271200v4 [Glycine max]|uniref:Leucine-rich repeat-containing N-terminal plant-type domain-containing protein n=1 Tax=Glycine max TaxID=3847 RepID=A0A0R0LBR3_SOYBN|nr:hypothetical protein GYH30_005356 [Glycine max]KRH73396.1 hypothetical protein GLYMA_02G271200v4 [Glycine max]
MCDTMSAAVILKVNSIPTAPSSAHNCFYGSSIYSAIGDFVNLTLFLAGCNLDGLLPSSLFTLTQLSVLDLSGNKLVAPIPSEINKLPKLSALDLSHNMLNGTIPPWCFSLPSLLVFDLSGNQLIGSIGDFPNSIFELQNLTDLILSSNYLSGQMDFLQFSKLKNLLSLHLSHNSFVSINFDDSVDYFLPNLNSLFLSSCNINSFPKFLARVPDLLQLDLSHNHIRGSIPKWFCEKLLHSWENIYSIDHSFNKLEGDLLIPPSGIQYFLVSNNKLTGTFLQQCAMQNLTGQIPQCLGTFPSLYVLDLQVNNLHGNMPWNFSKGNSFETIKLNENRLVGQLPQSLANCTKLEVLDLGNNNIEDTFPHWLETLQEFQVLSLRSNKFHGVITCFGTKHSFPMLRILDVSDNNFSGPLPASCIKNFQGMSLYNDSVVVVMKGQFMDLERILFAFTTIDLSNMFEGEIPKVIGELHSLKGLNLSHNSITGRQFNTLGNDSYAGNPMLCGFPLSKSCNEDEE